MGKVCLARDARACTHKGAAAAEANTDAHTCRLVLARLEQGNQISSRERWEGGVRGVLRHCREPIQKKKKKTLQAHIGLYTPQNPHTVSRETKNCWEDASCLLERQGELKVTDTSPVQDPLPGPMSRSCTPAQGT